MAKKKAQRKPPSPLVKSIEARTLTSFDGTELCYYVGGEGVPVVIANGLGGSLPAWTRVFEHFETGYRFITWDYRGLYRSSPPDELSQLAIPCHAEDMAEVLRAEGVEKAIFIGWSMGVQVILEFCRRWGHMPYGVIALNGTSGDPFRTAQLGGPFSGEVIRRILNIPLQAPKVSNRVLKRFFDMQFLGQMAKQIGLIGRTADLVIFRQVTRNFATLDFETYCRIFLHLGDHSAADVLQTLQCPLLVIAGEDDPLTPLETATYMKEEAPDAELCIVPYGTHFCLIEFAEYVNLRMEQFFKKVAP